MAEDLDFLLEVTIDMSQSLLLQLQLFTDNCVLFPLEVGQSTLLIKLSSQLRK